MASEVTTVGLAGVRGARVLFAHQSVGDNILAGVPAVFAAAGEPTPRLVESRTPPASGPFFVHTRVGENTDPHGKLAGFEALVDGAFAGHLDVAVLKFCYADIDAGTDVVALFDSYRECLADLGARHPTVAFVAATVPLTTDRSSKARLKAVLGRDDRRGPADNLSRHRYNTLVRSAHSGDELFDIAAVEATLETTPMVRRLAGEEFHVLNPTLSVDPGHLNSRGSVAGAAALLAAVAAALCRR